MDEPILKSPPRVGTITVFPIKSLDGLSLEQVRVTQGGALTFDRTYALFNKTGRTVNGKKYPAIHQIRTTFDLENQNVFIQTDQDAERFNLETDQSRLEAWFSEYFKEPVFLKKNTELGFPDDDESNGPTIVSTATFKRLRVWFPHLEIGSLRQRFRANIELEDREVPFWEDHLFGKTGEKIPFRIGNLRFFGTNPCARCAVPTRDPRTGIADPEFARTLIENRKKELPSFANISQFDHFNRLCVNTVIHPDSFGKILRVHDGLTI